MDSQLQAFPSGKVLIMLDNFEDVMDHEALTVRDRELEEAPPNGADERGPPRG